MASFRNRTVLITGAARGLGLLLAEGIAAEGGRPVLVDLDAAELKAVGERFAARGQRVASFACDVTSRQEVAATCARAQEECGPIDVLVNNAGVVSGRFLLELTDEQIERTLAVNTLALFWLTRALLPSMLERGRGHIVTIASAAGIVGTAKQTDYAASKHAAVGFDEALRCELSVLGRRDIRTTVICPFYISTGMFDGVRGSWLLPVMQPEAAARAILKAIRRERRRVYLPPTVALVHLGRFLPAAWFDWIMRRLGVSRSMDAFRGRIDD